VILITGSSPSEGKTTTAVNLAASLALAGKRVILIESDLRRPVLGQTLGVQPEGGGVVSLLIENSTLSEALVQTSTYGPNLQLLLADYEGGWIAELFSIPSAERMVADARRVADYVIIDSPPLNEVVDALPLARQADDVLIVVRLGITRLDKLRQLGELLAESRVRPAGFAVIGTPRPSRGEYHYYAGITTESVDGRARRALMARSSEPES
jgi:capsular exopolysaccharide synthesis family protein